MLIIIKFILIHCIHLPPLFVLLLDWNKFFGSVFLQFPKFSWNNEQLVTGKRVKSTLNTAHHVIRYVILQVLDSPKTSLPE